MKEKIEQEIAQVKVALMQKLISVNEYQDFIYALYQKLKTIN